MVKSQPTSKSAMPQGDGAELVVGGAMSPLTPVSQRPPDGSSSKGNPINAASAFPVGDARVMSVAGDSSISSSNNCMSQYGGMSPAGGVEGVANKIGGEIRAADSLSLSTAGIRAFTTVCLIPTRCRSSSRPSGAHRLKTCDSSATTLPELIVKKVSPFLVSGFYYTLRYYLFSVHSLSRDYASRR